MEDYVIIAQTVDKDNKPIFNKVLRKSDDAIFEVGETKNKYGLCYSIFFEANDYRKMVVSFIKGEDITPFRLNDAPANGEDIEYFYYASNELPSRDLQELLFRVVDSGMVVGTDAKEYRMLLKEWNYNKLMYSAKDEKFISVIKSNDKKITDYKFLFRMG